MKFNIGEWVTKPGVKICNCQQVREAKLSPDGRTLSLFCVGMGLKKRTDTGAESVLALDGVFVAVGQVPGTAPFAGQVDLDGSGYFLAGEDCRTNLPGVFAAGDCRRKAVRQLATAVADGAVAGLGAAAVI